MIVCFTGNWFGVRARCVVPCNLYVTGGVLVLDRNCKGISAVAQVKMPNSAEVTLFGENCPKQGFYKTDLNHVYVDGGSWKTRHMINEEIGDNLFCYCWCTGLTLQSGS